MDWVPDVDRETIFSLGELPKGYSKKLRKKCYYSKNVKKIVIKKAIKS
jgi:hypothetical protein